MPILQISSHYNFFSIDFKNMFAKKRIVSIYIEKEYSKKIQLLILFRLSTDSKIFFFGYRYWFNFSRDTTNIFWNLIVVYYKSLSDKIWRENDWNWAYFYSNKILCVGWGRNKIFIWITNMTNFFYVKITFLNWIVQYFQVISMINIVFFL